MDWNAGSAAMIGRTVVDHTGQRIGKVIAVIHAVHGVDLLVERRRWLMRSGCRIPLEDMTDGTDGRIVVATADLVGRRTEAVAATTADVTPRVERR